MFHSFIRTAIPVGVLAVGLQPASAEVRLPHLLSDNMVLQRDLPIPIWGWANSNEKVTVRIGKSSASATAGTNGQWSVKLPKMTAGGPYELTVAGANTLTLTNVLIGEVWLCSGQSNMHWTMAPGHGIINNDAEVAAAKYPNIRMFTVAKSAASRPADDADGTWLPISPENLMVGGLNGASALAYLFGRELYQKLNVPIALINASDGGTGAEQWISLEAVQGNPALKPLADQGEVPTRYNAMIAPVTRYAIRGAIWYQGESNMGDGMLYFEKMQTLITGWRKDWAEGDFPFLFAQVALSNYSETGDVAPRLWEAQTATLTVPNTGMVVTHDVSSYPNCHAPNKQDVGKRLALWALAKTYGKSGLVYSGPIYKSMAVTTGPRPAKVRIQFDYTGSGLASRDGKPLNHFTIAGEDKKFVEAKAVIEGKTVVAWSDAVAKPVAVRFGWRQDADPNLMNKEGLPAPCFRTDKWEK
jgi:sialate O-acetylesterase